MIYFVGIDNGVTGTCGVISEDTTIKSFFEIPVTRMLNYQKSDVKHINRIDVLKLVAELEKFNPMHIGLERPMVNPKMFNATMSGIRALEAILIVIDILKSKQMVLSWDYLDSKEWQRYYLPKHSKYDDKKALSKEVGLRTFPMFEKEILNHKDADGIFIADFVRRYWLEKMEIKNDNKDISNKSVDNNLFE